MSNSMLVTMLLIFSTLMFGWHQTAIYIVTHYGIVGILNAIPRIADMSANDGFFVESLMALADRGRCKDPS